MLETEHWRAIADELERMLDDYETSHESTKITTADALVVRVRMLIAELRRYFQGN